ncbi:MAG: TonB-dependent receptor [Bacteroidota bacterium]|nr:TonB-dependent receptor [Bacteroidota bacterium]
MKVLRVILTATLILILSIQSIAQSTGIIQGEALDALNISPLHNWKVEVVKGDFKISTTVNNQGYFEFKDIPSGLYNVRALSPKGQIQTLHEVRVRSTKPTYVNLYVERISTLNEVAVRADAFHRTPETPLSIKNINRSEMMRMPGAVLDLSKVIQNFPGVLPKPSFGYAIAMRGGAPNENRYLLDGISLPTVNHFSIQGASGGAVSLINLDHIQGMDLVTGGFPADVDDALSGILKLEGRNARTDRWGVRATQGGTDYGVTLEGPAGDKTLITISGRNSFSQHYFKLFNIPVLPTYQDAQLRIHHKIGPRKDITIIGVGGWDDYKLYTDGRGSDALLYNVGYIPEGTQQTEVLGARYRSFTNNGRWEYVLSRDHVGNQAEKFIGNTGLDRNRQLDYSSTETNTRFNISHHVVSNNWQWKYGLNLVFRDYGLDMWNVRYNNDTAVQRVDTVDYLAQQNFFSAGVFTHLTRHYLEHRLSTSVGVRIDMHSLNLTTINPLAQLSPRMSALYHLNESWTVQGNLGSYTQMPPAITILTNTANNWSRYSYAGRVNQAAAGIEFQNGQTYRFSLEGYYKDYRQMPYLWANQMSFSQAIGAYVAVGDQVSSSRAQGRSYGLELFLQQKLKGSYWWTMSYNFGYSETRLDASQVWKPTVWDNRHNINLVLGKVWGKGWQIGAKYRWATGTPYTPFDSELSALIANWDVLQRGIFDVNQIMDERLPAYSVIDVRLDKTYNKEKYSLTWYLDLQNFTSSSIPLMPYLTVERDELTSAALEDPNSTDSYLVKTIDSDTGRLLPTIGLILEI